MMTAQPAHAVARGQEHGLVPNRESVRIIKSRKQAKNETRQHLITVSINTVH